MADKLAYEELKQKVKELEKEAVERKCGEEKAEHLTAVLRAIRNVNQLIVREKHPGRLVEGVCDTLIETRGYYNAWVALLDESGVVMTTAEAGLGKLFLPMVELLKRGTLTDCGRRALKQSGVVVVEDPFSACSDCPLAGKYGDRGAMTIRLEYSGKVRGLLAVSTPRDRATEAEEQGLLEEVARDIAFALHSLELEEDRRLAEEALEKLNRELEERVEERTAELIKTNEQLKREIEERKQVEKVLRREAREKAIILNSLSEYLVYQDPDMKIIWANRAAAESVGLTPEQLVGRRCYEIWHQRDGICEGCPVWKALKSKQPAAGEMRTPDGRVGFVRAFPVHDGRGKLVGVVEAILEITEQKGTEQALRESEERYRMLVETMNEGVVILDENQVITYSNNSFCQMLHYDRDEVVGRSVLESDFHDDVNKRILKEQIAKRRRGARDRYEFTFTRKDGQKVFAIISPRPILDVDNLFKGSFAVITDITKRVKAEEALARLNESLLTECDHRKLLSKKLIGLLESDRHRVAMELHDHIGQTLTTLKIDLEMIMSRPERTDTELRYRIKSAQNRVARAIKDIKDVSHGLRPSMLDQLGLVASLSSLAHDINRHTGVQVKFFARDVPKRFNKEKELAIYRICQEALTNVIKHARAENVFVNLVKRDQAVMLSVEDDGVGFEKEEAMEMSKDRVALGLLIMEERTVQVDGKFSVESRIGGGTHLTVEIPI